MYKIVYLLLLLTLTTSNTNHEVCRDLEKDFNVKNPYEWFNGVIERETKTFNKTIVKGKKRQELIKYVKKINNYIVNMKVEKLIENISKKHFERYDYNYWDGSTNRGNISSLVVSELKRREGNIYYLIFDRTKENKNNLIVENKTSENVCVREFLRCFEDRIEWIVLYNSKLKQYDIWFSMPIGFLISFSYFHYVVKEEEGKYVLVGF